MPHEVDHTPANTGVQACTPRPDSHAHDEHAARAHALIHRCAGIEEAGLPDMARESRYIAGALLDTLAELAAERSARTAIQNRCNHLQQIVGKAAYQACVNTAP